MKLQVKRFWPNDQCVQGVLYVNGAAECYTLEDPVREVEGQPVTEWKVVNQTAIPLGSYEVVIDYSERFKRPMPHLLNVPGFEGIRIHSGNTANDVSGCILVGVKRVNDYVLAEAHIAFDALMLKLNQAVIDADKIEIEVTDSGDGGLGAG